MQSQNDNFRGPLLGLNSSPRLRVIPEFFRIRLAWFRCVLSLVIHLWRCRSKCFSVKSSRLGACFLWCIPNGVFFTRKLRKFEAILLYKGRGQFSYYSLTLPKASEGEKGQPQPLCPSETSQQTGLTGAPNGNFRENICSEDDLRSRIFGAFVVTFLACLPLLGFSNIYKMV